MGQINIFVFVFIVLAVKAFQPYKLLLTVYYESECPDTQKFVLEQLQPAVHLLHQYLTLKFVPFGKAYSVDYGFGGFECQHGQSECYGNMVHDCALHLMKNVTDVDRVAYVACEMHTRAAAKGSMECVEKANLKAASVKHCIEFGKGTMLQLESEYYTELVKPSFIPSVTIDGIYNQQTQDSSLVDLTRTLCSHLRETPPCAQLYNNIAMSHILNSPEQIHPAATIIIR